MEEGTGSITPKEPSLKPKVFDQLFNQELVNLSIEERRKMAQTYINRFCNTKITYELLQEAGISLETTDPGHIEMARLLSIEANMSPESIRKIKPAEGEQIKQIQNPFYYNAEANMIKQYGKGEEDIVLKAQQTMNRFASIIGEKYTVPELRTVGVLYFKSTAKT